MSARIDGADVVVKGLKNFDRVLAKEVQTEMAAALKPIVQKARGYAMAATFVSGWRPNEQSKGKFPKYDAAEVGRGITYTTTPSRPNRHGFSYAARIKNRSAAGAIYETAGRKRYEWNNYAGSSKRSKSKNPNAGAQFVDSMPPLVGESRKNDNKMAGRLIFRAWNESQGRAYDAVNRAIQKGLNTLSSTTRRAA